MLIVDGHNLAFADDEARRLLESGKPDAARQRVLRLVTVYANATRQRARVVFDGTGGYPRPAPGEGRVSHCFSGADRSADERIIDLVTQATGRRELCVVTGDRALGSAVRSLQAGTVGVQEFLKEIARILRRANKARAPEPRAKRFGAPPDEVEYWLRHFREEDAAAAEKGVPPVRRKRKR